MQPDEKINENEILLEKKFNLLLKFLILVKSKYKINNFLKIKYCRTKKRTETRTTEMVNSFKVHHDKVAR